MSRVRRSVLNYASSLLLQSVTLAVGIFSTPLLLKWLGDDRFGAFRSVADWITHLKILELGLAGAMLPLLAGAIAQQNRSQVELTLAVAIRAYCKVLFLMLGAAIVLSFAILHLVPVQQSLATELHTAYWISLLGILLLPFTPFRLLIEASHRGDIINLTYILQSLIITSVSLYLASQGLGMPGQFLAIAIGATVATIFVSWKSLLQYPRTLKIVIFASTQATQPVREQLQKLSTPTLIYYLFTQIGLFTDNLVIAYFLGPASVVPFVMTQRLFAIAQAQVQSVGNATWSSLADLYTKGELEQFNLRLVQLTALVATFGMVLIIPILVYNFWFVQLWVGAERFAGLGVTVLAAMNAVMMGVLSLWGWCFSGTGNVAAIARLSALVGILNISVSLLVTPSLQLIGPLLGTFVSFFGLYFWGMLYQLKREFGASPRSLLTAVIRPLLVTLLYVPCAMWFAQTYPPQGWLSLVVSMISIGLTFLGIAWLSLLNSVERFEWSQRFKQVLFRSTSILR